MTSYLPDVNVLVALSLDGHLHAKAAHEWYRREQSPCLQVCRIVQLGFLRLLTTQSVAGAGTLTNKAALNLHLQLVRKGLIELHSEPDAFDRVFADRAATNHPSPNRWNDAYLSAFAESAGLRLVTFDATLASYTRGSVLLHV